MRGSIAKHIDELVRTEEVLSTEEMNMEIKPNNRRRKKIFWNKLNCIEKAKRSFLLRKEDLQ